jgi:PAS domain S-box-containing protein
LASISGFLWVKVRTRQGNEESLIGALDVLGLVKAGEWQIDFNTQNEATLLSSDAASIYGWPTEAPYFPFSEWRNRVQTSHTNGSSPVELFQQAIRDPQVVYDCTYAFQRPIDDKLVWLRDRGVVRRDPNGRAIRVLGIVVDVSEAVEQRNRLSAAQLLSQNALELANAGTWRFDLVNAPDLIIPSEEALRIWGIPSGTSSIHTSIWSACLQDQKATAELAQAKWDAVLHNAADAYDMTYAYRRPSDGQVAWLRSRGLVRRDANGTPLEMTGVVVDVTESTLQKDALVKSGMLARTALGLLKAGTWDWDVVNAPDVTTMSPEAAAIIGYHSAEPHLLTADQWRNSILPVSPEYVAQNTVLLEQLKRREIAGYDVKHRQIRADDGTLIWARVVANAIYDATGNLTRVFGVTLDVTEQVQEEAALKKSQLISEQALEMSHSGTWWVNCRESSDYFYTTERTNAIFGAMGDAKQRVVFKKFMQQAFVADPTSAKAALAAYKQFLDGASDRYDVVHAYTRPDDNQVVWVHNLARMERDAEGDPVQIYGVVMDVTERIHTERQILQTNMVLEQALALSKAATWSRDFVADSEGINFSQRALLILGFKDRPDGRVTGDEMNQRTCAAAGSEAAASLAQQIKDLFAGIVDDYELKYPFQRESDGELVWLHDIGSVKRNSNREITTMHGVLRDITRERLAEESILAAMEAAEAASRAKGDFLANMSHEIRTPMNAIIGLSGLALKNEMPPRIHDYLSKIRQSGEHLLGIINDILDFSKIDSGKMEIESIPFDLDDVINNVVNLISEKVESKGLELLCQVHAEVPRTLIGDPLRIGQILINLTNNAVKFTEHGEVHISIQVEEVTDGRVLLLFRVQDTGIGLTVEQTGKLFNSFAQADTSITRKYGGTGLGLAISKSLAQAMEGDIGAESVLGKGSTFWFSARLGVGSSEHFLPTPGIDIHGARVLVVDDNKAAALVLSETLTDIGFAVDQVHSGLEALEALRSAEALSKPYVFVMMDWQMPGMDGLEAVKAIQDMLPHAAPFVLMVTAHRRQELIKGAQRLGISHVLSKPVSGSMLVNTMMQIMGHGQAISSPIPAPRATVALEGQLGHLGGARILLVEDNEINQLVASELLHLAGFQVDVAENGQVGVHQVHARESDQIPYDLVLMDMQMPVMDGVTASRLIRERYTADQLPIVAMTANAMRADRDRCIDAGMNAVVTKPINPEELWKALLDWIKVRPGMGQPFDVQATAATATDELPALMQALQAIPDLDVKQGLQRCTHNPAFYASMLRRFVVSQEGVSQRIEEALASKDLLLAERLAHTLKGVAGNLGASSIQHDAEELENALQRGTPMAQARAALERTAAALDALITALKAAPGLVKLESPLLQEKWGEAEHAELERLVDKIRLLLAGDDPDAQTEWEAHARLLRANYPNGAAIEAAINDFDFEQALALMDEAVSTPH